MPLWPGPIPAPAVKRGSFLIFKQTAMSFPLQPCYTALASLPLLLDSSFWNIVGPQPA